MNLKLPRARRLFAKLLLLLVGFLLGCLVAEVALRIVGYSYPEFYTLDQIRGYALRPGAEGWYRKEGEAYVRINSDGLRDQEHSLAKPPDTIRIAVIGDSYPEALSVSPAEAFWSVMARKLQECEFPAGKQIEVINFGVSGYGTAQELLTLREQVWKYSPDIVMLTVTTNNDITDNLRALKKTDEIPYFVYTDHRLTLDDSFRNSRGFRWRQSGVSRFGRWLRDHSRVVQAATQGHHGFKILLSSWRARHAQKAQPPTASPGSSNQSVWKYSPDIVMLTVTTNNDIPDNRRALRKNDEIPYSVYKAQSPPSPGSPNQSGKPESAQLARTGELGADNLVYLEPADAVWNDAWSVTEGLIMEMRNEVVSHGAKFVVITLSNGPQVLPDSELRENYMTRFGITDLLYPDHRIKSLGTREEIPVVTLAPELQEFAERNRVFLHGFGEDIGNGHWNSTGHRVAGELIAKKFCEGALLK
jgi:lysophospholipase L1-like esterase